MPSLQSALEDEAKRGQKGKLQLAPELADEYNRIKQAGWRCFAKLADAPVSRPSCVLAPAGFAYQHVQLTSKLATPGGNPCQCVEGCNL